MPSDQILFILGAGASKAANSQMPLITEFFRRGAEYAKRELDEKATYAETRAFWEAIPALENTDLETDSKGEYENIWGENRRHRDESMLGRALTITRHEVLQDKMPQAMREYLDSFLNNTTRVNANIETILWRAEKLAIELHNDSITTKLKRFIVWLFARLENDNRALINPNPHRQLIQGLIDKKIIQRCRFISFNYDQILERTITALNPPTEPGALLWHPQNGYGFEVKTYISQISGKEKPLQNGGGSQALVLKPHGSVGWFIQNSETTSPLLDDSDPKQLSLPSADAALQFIESEESANWKPVLIAPGRVKRFWGEHFWSIRNEVRRLIRGCKTIIVIGWNIPETDTDIKEQIIRYMDERGQREQLEKLIVCDRQEINWVYDRHTMIFAPRSETIALRKGFENEVDSIIKQL